MKTNTKTHQMYENNTKHTQNIINRYQHKHKTHITDMSKHTNKTPTISNTILKHTQETHKNKENTTHLITIESSPKQIETKIYNRTEKRINKTTTTTKTIKTNGKQQTNNIKQHINTHTIKHTKTHTQI